MRILLRSGLAALLVFALGEAVIRLAGLSPPLEPEPRIDLVHSDNPVLAYVPYRLHARPPEATATVLLGDEHTDAPLKGDGLIDLSAPGYCALAKVELLSERVAALSPERVVLVVTPDDHDDFNHAVTSAPGTMALPWAVRTALELSHLARLTARHLDLFGLRTQTREARFEANATAIGVGNVERALQRLLQLSRRHRFHALVALWPGVENPTALQQQAAALGLDSIRLSRHAQQDLRTLALAD